MDSNAIYMYFISNILIKLPFCRDLVPTVLSYIRLPDKKIAKLLAYKLIQLNNVKNIKGLLNTVNRIDQCPTLVKSFDLIWDLIKMFLIHKKERKIIEHWYTILTNPINYNVWIDQFLKVKRVKFNI
jgi:hypothetical protein